MPCDWHIHFCSILQNTKAVQCSILFKFCKALRIVLLKGEGNVTPWFFTLFALNIHDTYIVNNHGEDLKAKAPPSIWLCCVLDWNGHQWYIETYDIY